MATIPANLKRVREHLAEYHKKWGAKCSVMQPTYDSTKKLYGPPYTAKKTGVYFTVTSITIVRDPQQVTDLMARLGTSIRAYRRLTCPYVSGLVIEKNDRIVKEPVRAGADTYQVIEAIAPDETMPVELLFHCQKV